MDPRNELLLDDSVDQLLDEESQLRTADTELMMLEQASYTLERRARVETARRQRRLVMLRPLRIAVGKSAVMRGAADDEAEVDATMVDMSHAGIGFLSPRKMESRDRLSLTLHTGFGVVTLFYQIRRAAPAPSSLWRVGGELLGALGTDRATRPEAIVWALMRGTCAGCGN